MNYKIIVDSCCDLPKEYRENEHFAIAPLTIEIDGERIVDDETFDQASFIAKMKKSPNSPKTSCPSPQDYMDRYASDANDLYVVTLSAALSGSYNSAELGKNLYLDENKDKNIHIFNSLSASSGEVLIALKIYELVEAGLSFDEVCEQVEAFVADMSTVFVLDSIDNLKKNGRLSNLQAIIVNALNIKLVMGAAEDGSIKKLDQLRGMKKALVRMAEHVEKEGKNLQNKVIAIAHCNCYERAVEFKNEILKRCKFKDILILEMAGISTVYANDGGIVIAY